MTDFKDGLLAWFNGWKYIFRHRRLMAVAAIPFLISLAAAVAAVWLISSYYPVMMNALVMSWLGGIQSVWVALLIKPLIWLGGIVVILVILYAVYVLHAIVAQPFYSVLADQTLKLAGKSVAHNMSLGAVLRSSGLKGLIFLFVGLLLFVCSVIPGLNLAAIAGTLLLVAFDCLDYSLESRGLKLRRRFAYVAGNKAQWAGIAAGLALTLLLPGLTLLVIPGAVVGAALILKDTNESRTSSP
jgi:CysZ protein